MHTKSRWEYDTLSSDLVGSLLRDAQLDDVLLAVDCAGQVPAAMPPDMEQQPSASGQAAPVCAICYDPLLPAGAQTRALVPPNNHAFHEQCISDYVAAGYVNRLWGEWRCHARCAEHRSILKGLTPMPPPPDLGFRV